MENLLLLERNKSKALTEQLYQAQIELKQFRGTRDVSECTSPKQNSESDSSRSRIDSTRNQLISSSALPESNIPMNVRLKHNIPHKYIVDYYHDIGGWKILAFASYMYFVFKNIPRSNPNVMLYLYKICSFIQVLYNTLACPH